MQLFLASSLDKTLPLLLPKLQKPAKELRVLFIANASDPIQGETRWVEEDRNAFKNSDCQLTEIDLRELSREEFIQKLNDIDIVHICGGSVLYILWLLRKKEIFDILVEAIKHKKIIYTGTSAGSIIAAPSVQLYSHDPEEREAARNLQDFTGLNLVPFLIKPHMNNKEHLEMELLARIPEQSLSILLLQDSQAVWVEDEQFEINSL